MAGNQDRPRDCFAPRPLIGKPFNPIREICGFYAPDIVGRQTDLTDGQKRLYERGVRWCGKNGTFWYSFQRMALELGKSARQVKRDMAELEKRGLIQHERRGKRQSNRYRFLYHPMFEHDGTSTSPRRAESEVTYLSGEVTSKSPCDVPPAAQESCKENYSRKAGNQNRHPRGLHKPAGKSQRPRSGSHRSRGHNRARRDNHSGSRQPRRLGGRLGENNPKEASPRARGIPESPPHRNPGGFGRYDATGPRDRP